MTRVMIEVIRNLTDQREGTRAEVELNEATAGMINGGFWRVVESAGGTDTESVPRKPRLRAQPAAEGTVSGEDQA